MALSAVVNKYGFQGWLNTGNFCFVNIALALFLSGVFNIEINQFLTVYDGDPKLLSLGGIK